MNEYNENAHILYTACVYIFIFIYMCVSTHINIDMHAHIKYIQAYKYTYVRTYARVCPGHQIKYKHVVM